MVIGSGAVGASAGLFDGLVDDAGLFPPERLTLETVELRLPDPDDPRSARARSLFQAYFSGSTSEPLEDLTALELLEVAHT